MGRLNGKNIDPQARNYSELFWKERMYHLCLPVKKPKCAEVRKVLIRFAVFRLVELGVIGEI